MRSVFAHPVTDEYVRLYVNRKDLGRFHNIKSVLTASHEEEKGPSEICVIDGQVDTATVIDCDQVHTQQSQVDARVQRQDSQDKEPDATVTVEQAVDDPIESFTANK